MFVIKKKVKYGNLPIRRAKFGGRHPHVIVEKNGNKNFSVGLTHSEKSGSHKTHQVEYSNGKKAYMVHYATYEDDINYYKNVKKYHLSLEDEKRAIQIVKNSSKYKNKK